MRRSILVTVILFQLSLASVTARSWLNWNWVDYSNWSLLTKSGDYTQPHWWWFRPEKRPVGKSYILMNHKTNSWVPTYAGCAFNPNSQAGQKFTVIRKGITFEYFLFESVAMVSPVPVSGGKVIAQTKGPRITGGLAVCGVRYFPPGVPVIAKLPF